MASMRLAFQGTHLHDARREQDTVRLLKPKGRK